MLNGLTRAQGSIYPVTLLGRWIDRAAGVDEPEQEREVEQRKVQERRIGTWGSASNGAAARPIDPAQGGAAAKRDNLMTHEQLYALWEKRNWKAHELDFSVDREQWLASPSEAQKHTAWSMSSFYVGEERVAADLAPFVLGRADRRDRDLPRDPAGRRGPPRGLLRPLGGRGDGALRRRHARRGCRRPRRR